jgi:hypothetical protein
MDIDKQVFAERLRALRLDRDLRRSRNDSTRSNAW